MEREGTARQGPLGQSYIIKRPRLTKLLDDSEARIILLVAPAGYGKTTLAREWLSAWRGPVAWYSTSSASADVAALSIGIAEELDLARGDADKPTAGRLAALTAVQQRPDALARALARSRSDWPARLVLAIDDYHHLSEIPAVESFIGALIHLLPINFVITSRSRPNWVAPRFAVYGEAFEIGASQLAMTDDEARDVLRRSRHELATNSIELAHGWPAIIGLAARTEADDLPNVIPARLYEFLAGDLVGAAPAVVQEALAVLAVAGVVDQATAHDLLGPGSVAAIEEAEKRGLLTLSGTSGLTLHPLLRDFLVARLRRDPGTLASLVDQLVPTLIASRRWNECLAVAETVPETLFHLQRVLETALEELLSEGRVATVSKWIELARSAGLDAPVVDLADGEVALLAGDYERALALGSRAARGFDATKLRTRAQLLAGRAAHFTDSRRIAEEWFTRAERSASSNDARAAAIWGQFLVEYENEARGLHDSLARYIAAADGSIEHELRCEQGRMFLAIAESDFKGALDASITGVALLSRPVEALTRLATLNQHAWLLVWAGRYADALTVSDRALAEADLACVDFAATHHQLTKATALVGLRRFSSAQQILVALDRRVGDDTDQWVLANLRIAQAKLQISLGDLRQAEGCLAIAPDSCQPPAQRSEYDGYRALIAAAQGFTEEASDWAQRSSEGSTHIEGVVLPAVTRAIIGVKTRAGAQTISEQFEIAQGSGLNDSVVMACRACPDLAAQVSQTAHRESLAAILSESRDAALGRTAGVRLPRPSRHADGLSPRELEVYELIVQGRTNREIAQTLFIAESTTKVHVRHILEKLGVRSRVEAVRAWRLDSGS